MWIQSIIGFFSIVEKTPGVFSVRARERGDLVRLNKLCGFKRGVIKSPDNDYPFRILLSRDEWLIASQRLAWSVNYDNFKSAVKDAPGQAKKAAPYMKIWGILADALGSGLMRGGMTHKGERGQHGPLSDWLHRRSLNPMDEP